jgi:phosphomethylpyrimidine synthase
MAYHNKQNPYFERFDDILDIARKYDVTLSLGDGLRPGCLADANDSAQFSELEVLGELTTRAWQKNVQVIIEGPGHIPIDKIVMNVEKARKICREAPFYVLGPIVTDIAPGYDHITSAIGSAIAGWAGASFICYVTPSEHLGLPTVEDVRVGVISARISAHIADMARGIKGAREWDDEMSRARFAFDWEKQFKLAIDPDRAREIYSRSLPEEAYKTSEFCSMCGAKFCAIRLTKKALAYDKRERSEDTE